MSDDEGRETLADGANDLARRQAALRALAQAQTQEAAPPATPRATSAPRPRAASAKPMLRIVPASANMACSLQYAWSPDSTRVAVLGNINDCGGSSSDSQTGAIFIYDATSGKLQQQTHPDQAIFKNNTIANWVGKNTTPLSASASLLYGSMTWTPDGHSMLLYFTLFAQDEFSSGGSTLTGLLRIGISSSAPTQIWLDHYQAVQVGDFERWDLTTGAALQAPMPAASMAYNWGQNGALIPTSAPGDGAVGQPEGGKLFTIWQSGSLTNPSFQSSPQAKPVISHTEVTWYANLTPISPDGRYFYSYFPYSVDLTPPSTTFQQHSATKAAPRDKALLALAQRLTQANDSTTATSTLVAYRPDGRLLAELDYNTANDPASVTASAFTVSIYNTTTGALVKRLTPDFNGLQSGNGGSGGNETLMWSPDGSRLLLTDSVYGALTIWGPGALPA